MMGKAVMTHRMQSRANTIVVPGMGAQDIVAHGNRLMSRSVRKLLMVMVMAEISKSSQRGLRPLLVVSEVSVVDELSLDPVLASVGEGQRRQSNPTSRDTLNNCFLGIITIRSLIFLSITQLTSLHSVSNRSRVERCS